MSQITSEDCCLGVKVSYPDHLYPTVTSQKDPYDKQKVTIEHEGLVIEIDNYEGRTEFHHVHDVVELPPAEEEDG